MAATLDCNLISTELLELDRVFSELITTYKITIDAISSIDNWKWENERKIEDLIDIEEVLNKDKIIIICLKCPLFKALGIYIESINDGYLYTLWINTEGYSVLDSDKITSENSSYYEIIYSEFLKLIKIFKIEYKLLAVGIETTFNYSENIMETIKNSENVATWIINDHLEVDKYGIYKKKIMDELNGIILENSINPFFNNAL